MPERFTSRIMKVLGRADYRPQKERALARLLKVSEEDYPTFRQAIRDMRQEGAIVIGAGQAISLPDMENRIVGIYESTSRGFGFVRPSKPTAQGDLFIPPGENLDAINGDTVIARVDKSGKREGQLRASGRVVEVVTRGTSEFVGTVVRQGREWFVQPDGRDNTQMITIADPGAKDAHPGDKVVVEILQYPSKNYLAHGVITEKLGKSGTPSAEMKGVIRRFSLAEKFSRTALNDTRAAVHSFSVNGENLKNREDIRAKTIITIDPIDARDFDDAISLERLPRDEWLLGVHIADVSHFIRGGSQLDQEARSRATSVYLPGQVIPMLPELLSNGVCSLQQGQDRFVKSAYIRLNRDGKVMGTRFANSVINSTQRLTYEDADRILAGETLGFDQRAVLLLQEMEILAHIIQARRHQEGMLSLDLPKAELIYDANGAVIDARPESRSFSHTLIEMFMVEANEAVARLLDSLQVPFLRRIHPEPSGLATSDSARILKLCGYNIPKNINRKGLQQLLESVQGKPESFIINLAILKSLQRAEYSPAPMGHYALASEHYCHFTSPIRRYPDLTVHRLLDAYLTGKLTEKTARDFPDFADLEEQGIHCSEKERNAESAERELREIKILQMLSNRVGEDMNAVVTSITNFGLFVQCERFLIEGLIKAEDALRGSKDGKGKKQGKDRLGPPSRGRQKFIEICPFKLGQELRVRVAGVNIPARQLDLVPV